ncbi:MAG: hypothetical protein EP300_01955 [Gammaproteobacteria bacterium]|nr:MAG: hypothetical protein EP300_01955 [Gammaproteobacteria bacterium]
MIDDGSALAFRVNVENFDNLLMAHIHVADGPVMLTDFTAPPVYWFNRGLPLAGRLAETINGCIAQGYIFIAGQLNPSKITSVEELNAAIAEGRALVIIHNRDFFPGDLRGTLK